MVLSLARLVILCDLADIAILGQYRRRIRPFGLDRVFRARLILIDNVHDILLDKGTSGRVFKPALNQNRVTVFCSRLIIALATSAR
jgi:hypothetical protein